MEALTEAQKQLVEENHNLIYSFINSKHLDIEEYYGKCALALCKAAKGWNEELGKFSTYAYMCMYNVLKTEYRDNTLKRTIPLNKISNLEDKVTSDSEDSDGATLLDLIADDVNIEDETIAKLKLDNFMEKVKTFKYGGDVRTKVVELLLQGKDRKEIAEELNISRQRISIILIELRDIWDKS